jgi:hypothetical protein
VPKEHCTLIADGLRDDPIGFLSKYVIAVADLILDESLTETGGPEGMVPTVDTRRFDAIPVPDAPGAPIFSLRESIGGDLQAHYLPWNQNTGYYIVLERDSVTPLFFTAMLSGCGVGLIEATDGSAVRFSHHNIVKLATMPDYAALDRSLAFAEVRLHPRDYRLGGDGLAHVHGVLKGGRWRFYAQVITMEFRTRNAQIVRVTELEKE